MLSSWQKKFFQSPEDTPAEGIAPPTDDGVPNQDTVTYPDAKHPAEVVNRDASEALPNEEAQDGVVQAEAITLTWSKTSLGVAYFLQWPPVLHYRKSLCLRASGLDSHSLIPVISIVSSVMSPATYMPLAKILNLWDRSIGFLLMVAFATLGLILSATCHDIGTYCAAQVFYRIGFAGIIFSVDVITADTSTLRDRGLAFAFTSSPYIITAFGGPAAAEHFYDSNWRWAYGCFSIVLPIVALPMFFLLRWNRHKAKKSGLLKAKPSSGRTWMESIRHYVIEFDFLGVFFLAAGLVLFLLPFSIAGTTEDDWKSASIITMLVIGLLCLLAFALVERFVAPVPFLPWAPLASRTVLGACMVDVCYQIAYYCWYNYYTSYLQVVYGTIITTAGYISSIFDVVSGVWLFIVGFLIKKTNRFRWLLFITVPLYILGVGLMIYFRRPSWSVGYMIMCQIFIAFAGGTMIICQQVAVLATSDHDHAASSLAFFNVFGTMGSAVGSSISGDIWTHTVPGALRRLLPEDVKADWETIYDSLEVQLSYERGTPTRHAIALAYAVRRARC
ncbi:hypothetical protein CDV55_100758 [Aspergillus turcosus]|uniref:Major facilitator superfamily (MFS) profile domain-containing protein n=1 Tax=Aspergillus turcosus TaxID=1245748 RepID=A0A229WVH7_9EURO|nr:hypothetical protein CDV55_100758 [Aspergillus turcosus]RLL98533.1 hypothetical protein CFD26_107777 [Aspergillus turcosus]